MWHCGEKQELKAALLSLRHAAGENMSGVVCLLLLMIAHQGCE